MMFILLFESEHLHASLNIKHIIKKRGRKTFVTSVSKKNPISYFEIASVISVATLKKTLMNNFQSIQGHGRGKISISRTVHYMPFVFVSGKTY